MTWRIHTVNVNFEFFIYYCNNGYYIYYSPMIEEIFEVEKLNKELNTDFIFNMSKISGVHFQSPSLLKLEDKEKKDIIFKKFSNLLKKNKYIENFEFNSTGFININLNIYEVLEFLKKDKKELIATIVNKETKKYLFDYGGPNIGKSMHVGHLRPLNIGRALYNIYSISNNECISDIHLGDWGIPISQILTFCYEKNINVKNISIEDLKKDLS